jgi:hypothetical protein
VVAPSKPVNLRKGEAGMAMVTGAWLAEARHDARKRRKWQAAAKLKVTATATAIAQ